MSTSVITNQATLGPLPPTCPVETPTISFFSSNSTTASVNLDVQAPFPAIRALFDYLHAHPEDPMRISRIPDTLRDRLSPHGLDDVLYFFDTLAAQYVPTILSSLSILAGTDLSTAHTSYNMNYRLCDYHPDTAAPESSNGCGAHTDYGTFSIIFQDGTPGLELEETPGTWVPVPGDATVILTGWCSTCSWCASVERCLPSRAFSDTIMHGDLDVEIFKELMGKRWRWREGNEEMDDGGSMSQDSEVEKLIWG
ncbi:hypothetical protein CNMCM5793_004920 [Aspergillus hiratsukae]|uniref:Isopenicillin N synthase-like Fe(2+) 2OG dioxygenase domain-containing protein n=1 Tax=Aspergillus hiratsukae TaxID=1194566 RepID=A0A8H6PFU8_9EURO|nr:hypothetical protein CNMCM5793_004920 [Aspergillus hiratsukae]KAF7170083.1 hypothetical protein CNMCM6106_004906 [Aspergillus hiratsukae]